MVRLGGKAAVGLGDVFPVMCSRLRHANFGNSTFSFTVFVNDVGRQFDFDFVVELKPSQILFLES